MGDTSCIVQAKDGFAHEEFSCMYPFLSIFYNDYEKGYDPSDNLIIMNNHPWIPFAAVFLYLVLIFGGQHYMKEKESWNWRTAMTIWNLLLSTFSWIGFFRLLPHALHLLSTRSLRDNLCMNPRNSYGAGSTGLWCFFFGMSKFPELFDTFFIVIHKKKLIFLHWYHHITVLLYCWFSYADASPPSIYFASINFFVHAVMYMYYFLMCRKAVPKWFNPMIVTMLQIVQMVAGVAITITGFHYYRNDKDDCTITKGNMIAAFLMYGSYLGLFLQFFVGRYFGRGSGQKKKKQ